MHKPPKIIFKTFKHFIKNLTVINTQYHPPHDQSYGSCISTTYNYTKQDILTQKFITHKLHINNSLKFMPNLKLLCISYSKSLKIFG